MFMILNLHHQHPSTRKLMEFHGALLADCQAFHANKGKEHAGPTPGVSGLNVWHSHGGPSPPLGASHSESACGATHSS